MPVHLTSPGVYIEELPAGSPPIPGVPTSITGFVGRAARGPTDVATTITSFREFEHTFGGLWLDSALGYSVRDFFTNGGRTAVIVRVHEPAADDVATIEIGEGASRLTLVAASPGAWGHGLSVVIDAGRGGRSDSSHFHLTVTDVATGTVEEYRRVSFDQASRVRVDRVLDGSSSLVRMRGDLPTAAPTSYPVVGTTRGGNDGGVVAADNFTTRADLREEKRGLYALDGADLVNLIVIPPYTDPGGDRPITEGGIDDAVLADVIAYAEQDDRGALVILDPPSAWATVADAVAGAATCTTSHHAALYFPRIRQPDPLRNNRLGAFAPSGAVAGVMARTDAGRGVWAAPAGLNATLDGVSALELAMTDAEIGTLNALGVNCLCARPGVGPVVWGARTRAGSAGADSEFKYVPVRRTSLFIEQSVRRGLSWAVFEPNDEALWSQIRADVGSFLDSLYREGALLGNVSDAYFVRCDASTTTAGDVAGGVVNVHLGFAPVRPAEFVVIRLQLTASPGPE